MKKVAMSLLAIAVVTIFANCGKNDNNGGPATMAATCANMNTSTAYNPYSAYGNTAYNTGYNTGGMCSYNYSAISGFTTQSNYYVSGTGSSCSYGQDAVYSPTKGKGCVSTQEIALSGQPAIYDISYGNAQYSTVSSPNPAFQTYQQSLQANPYMAQSYGYGTTALTSMTQTQGTQVLRVCDGSEACPNGQSCRSPFGSLASPPIGICYFN